MCTIVPYFPFVDMSTAWKFFALSALARVALAGTVVWDGSFNVFDNVAGFDKCKQLPEESYNE